MLSASTTTWHTIHLQTFVCSCADMASQCCWHVHFVKMLIYEKHSLSHLARLLPRRVRDVYGHHESDASIQLRARKPAYEMDDDSAVKAQTNDLVSYFADSIPKLVGMMTIRHYIRLRPFRHRNYLGNKWIRLKIVFPTLSTKLRAHCLTERHPQARFNYSSRIIVQNDDE